MTSFADVHDLLLCYVMITYTYINDRVMITPNTL